MPPIRIDDNVEPIVKWINLRKIDDSTDPELKGYFALSDCNDDEVSKGKMGGGPHSDFYSNGYSRGCKYEDEKDPLCVKHSHNCITGCCLYHRYKYNELLQGEKVSSFVVENINKRGGKIDRSKLTEWE